MPKLTRIDLVQLNRQYGDVIEELRKRIGTLEREHANTAAQVQNLDFVHAKQTTNNLVFTWHGGTGVVDWPEGFLQDKNANSQQVVGSVFSSSKGPALTSAHTYPVPAGSQSGLSASTYYWIGWNHVGQQIVFTKDVGQIFQGTHTHVICQIFTGTGAQTGVAGGGGSQSGVDLSGTRYKLF